MPVGRTAGEEGRMAKAGPIISVALAVLLIGLATESMANEVPADQPAGATLSGTAATVASPQVEIVARPRSWGIAERPRYAPGGWQCPTGLVWRDAGPRDWLCVGPEEARRIDQENAEAANNWVDGAEGSYTCRPGLVRREAFTRDIVCVDPARQAAVRQMNLALFSVR
jgi:hypothetical protein